MRLDTILHELAAGQHACVAIRQLRAHGATGPEITRVRRSSEWQPLSTRVLALKGSPETDEQRLMAAVLDASPGASVAGTTAAAFWGAPGYRLDPIHVDRHRGISRRPSRLAVVHEVVDLLPHHVKVVQGIPVIAPARVIAELAATQHPKRVERNLEWFWRERLLDGREFHRLVQELAERGRTGSTLLRELDAARGPGYRPTGSGVELRFEEILRNAGERPMRRQVDVGDDAWCGRVDFVDDELPLIVEVQSEKYHTALVDRAADEARKRRLRAAGFEVVEVWDTEVWHQPYEVLRRVCDTRARLSAGTHPAA